MAVFDAVTVQDFWDVAFLNFRDTCRKKKLRSNWITSPSHIKHTVIKKKSTKAFEFCLFFRGHQNAVKMYAKGTYVFFWILHFCFVNPIFSGTFFLACTFGLDGIHVRESPVQVDQVGPFNLEGGVRGKQSHSRGTDWHSRPSLLLKNFHVI